MLPIDKPDMLVFTRRAMIGVVAVILPWNAQMLRTATKLGPALAAVLKASEVAPVPMLEFARLIDKAGFPPSVVSIITGDAENCAVPLTWHADVDRIAFTGGPETAHDVVRNSAENFAVTTLELGGKSPILVFEDADLDGAANGLIAGNFDGSHRAIKLVMRWTSVSERTAKNWLAGSHGPAGEHLVELMRNSNEVLAAVLSLVGRGELKIGAGLHETRDALVQVLEVLDGLL